MVKPANNGAHSSASRKRAVTIPSEDEASTQSPKRNRSESNDQSDRLGPQSISNDNQTYRTPYAIKYYQGDQQKFTRLNCTYGRFTKSNDDKTSFLLYASSITQFEFLLKKENWPNNINNNSYTLELPNRTPGSYSLIVRNVPPQWNVESFGNELKQQYPMIIQTVRLLSKGEHMAGNPSCPVKLAKRKELNLLRMSSKSSNKPNQKSTNEYANKTTKQTFVPALGKRLKVLVYFQLTF